MVAQQPDVTGFFEPAHIFVIFLYNYVFDKEKKIQSIYTTRVTWWLKGKWPKWTKMQNKLSINQFNIFKQLLLEKCKHQITGCAVYV